MLLPKTILTLPELLDSNVAPPATSSVPAEDQPSLPAPSSEEEGSPTKEKLVVEVISEEEDASSSRPSNVSLEAPKELDPPLKKDSGLASPQDEGSPTKEVPSVGSHPRLTPQTHTSHKTYFASIQLTPTVTHKVLSDGQASSTPATTEQDDSSSSAPKERGPTGADKEGQLSGTFVSQHTLEIQGAKPPAKVFSFTFSPTQSTRPDTVLADLKGSSIIPSSVRAEAREAGERKKEGREEKEEQNQKEEEEEEEEEEKMTRQIHEEKNVLRSEGRRVFTVITNPNDVKRSHEKTNVNTEGSLNRHKTVKIIQQSEKSSGPKSPEVPAKPSWMKLVAQNLSNSSERRRTEEKGHEGGSSKAKAQQVTVEVVDEEEPRKRRSAKEEERRRSSLMEWEALQRQRLEDEEKNRINKNLSMKPVSAKIKELVKMHGSFMSMFSKDKKTDINGTVDGKDDILFRKIPSESSSFEVNEAVKDNTVPMKSPYIVRKLLSPLKQPSPQEVTPPQRASRKEAHKSSSSAHKSPRTSRRDSSKPRTGEGRRDASPHKAMSDSKRETTSVNGHHRYSSSSPSSRYRKAPITDPTPLDSSSTSKEKEAPVRSTRTPHSPSRSNEVKARHKDAAHTPKVTRKSSSSVDERSKVTISSSKDKKVKESKSLKAESDLNGAADESPNSFSHEQRRSEGRSSIKDPHNRREWVSRMLTTISDDHLALLEDKGSKSTASPPEPPPSPRKGRDKPSEGRAFPNLVSEEVVSSSSPASMSPAPTPPARKSSSSHRGLSSEPLASSTPTKTKFTSSFDSSEATPSSSSPTKPAIPTKPLSSLSKPSVSTDAPTASPKLSPSPPNTPTSLRSSLRDTLQSDSSNRRGPVSLSSILGDQSSRSSSRASTPLTSPRATPERVIRKDSLDQVPKLDVIPESSLGSPYLRARAAESALRASESTSRTTGSVSTADITLRTPDSTSKGFESGPRSSGRRLGTSVVEDQKENIAPSPIPQRSSEAKGNKVGEEGRTSANFSPSSYRSSFRLRDKSEERKEEDRKVTAKNNANASWRPSSYKPFTFGKPSVTLKAMTTGVDPQRVSTSKNTNVKREQKTETTALQNLKTDSVRAETKAGQPTTIKMEPNLPLSDESESPISTRFSTERKSLRSRISTNDSQSPRAESKTSNSLEDKVSLLPGSSSTFTRYSKDRVSQRSREISERSTPDRDTSGPVSLSSILTRDVAPKTSTGDDSTDFQFKPRLSFSEELNDITLKYRNDLTARRASSDMTQDDDEVFNSDAARGSSVEPESKEASPSREIKPRVRDRKKSEGERSRTSKEGSPAPKGLPKSSSSSSRAKSTRLVRRNSSLKRNRPEESSATSRPTAKKERKDSEDDPADLKTETLVQDPSGWTKTRTTVRRARLGSSEKTRQIARTNSGRNKKEKAFKTDASKALEEWAAGTKVPGKLMKKEGQRFSHETEEEVKHGQKTSRSVVRRVVRRGSRKMSGGGELLTETKETSSTGAKKGQDTQEETKVRSSGEGHEVTTYEPEDGLSRKMKTSTDGERYMTQSVSNKGGKMTFTTEGVNNKTTKSVEVIGGDDFEAQRKVEGKTGHRVVVESSTDLGRPSTVVKKVTSQSRVIITKTKRKTPVVV